jgi:hypothetical protein
MWFHRLEDIILRFATDLTGPSPRMRLNPHPAGQSPATHLRRCLAHAGWTDRLRSCGPISIPRSVDLDKLGVLGQLFTMGAWLASTSSS